MAFRYVYSNLRFIAVNYYRIYDLRKFPYSILDSDQPIISNIRVQLGCNFEYT